MVCNRHQFRRWAALLLIVIVALLAALPPVGRAYAAPPSEPTATTIELPVTDDARIQGGSPDVGFGSGFLWVGTPNAHLALVQFDLTVLPANVTINSAELRLHFTGTYTPTANVELGRNDGAWDEATVTWNTQPATTFGGPVQPIGDTASDISWNVTPLVTQWHSGALPNYGFALRGDGPLKSFHSKETNTALAPKLIITYSAPPDEGVRPDLGDAPDSSNSLGVNNTAYFDGTLGNFPTVWGSTPAGQPAGPRHANQTGEAILGNFLSRENEADSGPDQDGVNNILNGGNDNRDNDRGDDGWRNRNAAFADCTRTTLTMRVTKAPNATRNAMYLNVWFDGNHDGDWNDEAPCTPGDEGGAAIPSTEWIVQDFVVNLNAIAAGGFVDINVNTERVLNSSPVKLHWMRFTLSEERAVQSGGRADGRGPHPSSALGSYRFGETEDVLQKPAPLGEDGTLEVKKRVITNADPVEWLDTVTYEIVLRHNGGSQPIQAQLRDELSYPLAVYPTVDASGVRYITVASATGGAAPLQAQLHFIPPSASTPPQQVVKWQGTLQPNAEIKFTFLVRVLTLCVPGQQTQTIQNIVQARPRGGAVISDQVSFGAKCLGYDESDIDFEQAPIDNTIDLDEWNHFPWNGTVHNLHPVTVTLGIYQKPLTGTVAATVDTTVDTTSATQPKLLTQVTLGPNEKQALDFLLRTADSGAELALPDDSDTGEFFFCLLPIADGGCPSQQNYPGLHGHVPYQKLRSRDLGDAPDSTNHAGVAMAAYPGVQADFPTVFDPATGLPQGPRHNHPRVFHLGQRVSREAGADVGPDQDPLNNIVPAANDPDNDRGDDGTNLGLWNLNHCQTTGLPVQVAITPPAVNYFQQLGTSGYLNIWIDSNHDGDWADATECGQQPAVEHIVIDFPVNVVGLGAGLHILNVPTGLVPWPNTDKAAWVRITLGDRPSNKTLSAGGLTYGDGRGYPLSFRVGETEDYHYRPLSAGGGPDVAVHLTGRSQRGASQEFGAQAAALEKLGNFEIQMFRIDYENIGVAAAQNVLVEFQIPEKLRDIEIILVKGTDVSREEISFNFDKLSFILPSIEQNYHGSLVLGWYGCITCTVTAATANVDYTAVDYTATVNVTLDGDIDLSNNQSSTTLRGLLSSPIIGAFMDYTDDACLDRILHGPVVTNNSIVELHGKAEPNSIIAILIGLKQVATVTSDANGNFIYSANPGQGVHRIHAEYANQVGATAARLKSPRDSASGQATGVMLKVDTSLPFDPMSVCFVDSDARPYAVPTLGYLFGATQSGSWVRSGETYTFSLNASSENLNQYFKVTFADIVLSSLKDEDGDGTYQGLVIMPDSGVVQAAGIAATAKLSLLVGSGGTESSFSTAVTTGADGVISDRSTGQPLANASVSALTAQPADNGDTFFSAWSTSQSGQPNPQTTVADGKYSFSASVGLYRLDVVRDGYQPYRTSAIDASEEGLNRNIALSPVIAEAATHSVLLTENGFQPAVLNAKLGDVIEFVNVDLTEHSTIGSTWDSGLLPSGQSYKVKVTTKGSFSHADDTDGLTAGMIIVGDSAPITGNALYLPLVRR